MQSVRNFTVPQEPETLCERCTNIDLNSVFNDSGPISSKGRPIASLGDISTQENSACQLCRLFAAVRVPKKPQGVLDNRAYQLRAFSCLTKHGLKISKARLLKRPSIVLSVFQGQSLKEYKD
jgi:hypothetical protein